jgi:hypothetical protein
MRLFRRAKCGGPDRRATAAYLLEDLVLHEFTTEDRMYPTQGYLLPTLVCIAAADFMLSRRFEHHASELTTIHGQGCFPVLLIYSGSYWGARRTLKRLRQGIHVFSSPSPNGCRWAGWAM